MAVQLTRSAVRIYGALSALGNGTGSVLDNLLPFFEPILRQHNGEKLNPSHFANLIRETYRWNFNEDLVEVFTPYFERSGWITADIPGQANTTYTISLPEHDAPDPATQSIEHALRAIAVDFKEFSERLSPLTAIPRTVEEFEDILIEWLIYIEAFSQKSIDFKTGFRPDQEGTLRPFTEYPTTTSLRDDERFLCARFVKHSVENDPLKSELLSRIAAIGLLTEVVQDFVMPTTAIDKTDLVVYLDAPVAMELLGLSGRAARDNIQPLVSELQRIGASVRIFGQSIEELTRSLKAVLKNPTPTGPTAQALLRREILKEYVVDVARDPVPALEKLEVHFAYRDPDATPSEHKYFSKSHWEDLYSQLRFIENPDARKHDTDITALTYRQRSGRSSRDIFKSSAIVVTKNGPLAQVVRRFSTEYLHISSDAAPPVIHRRALVAALWLRTGMGAQDLNIPKRMLLASCEQVLAIRPNVVEAVKRLTDALGDEEKSRQLDLLVTQDRSVQALMDKTLGLANVVTEQNLHMLFDEMLHPHLEKERSKRQEEIKKINAEKKATESSLKAEIDSLRDQTEHASRRISEQATEKRDIELIVIRTLANDVKEILIRHRWIRRSIAGTLAAISSIPIFLDTTYTAKFFASGVAIVFSYLTITGGRLLNAAISPSDATALFERIAQERGLSEMASQFDVTWARECFQIGSKDG